MNTQIKNNMLHTSPLKSHYDCSYNSSFHFEIEGNNKKEAGVEATGLEIIGLSGALYAMIKRCCCF